MNLALRRSAINTGSCKKNGNTRPVLGLAKARLGLRLGLIKARSIRLGLGLRQGAGAKSA